MIDATPARSIDVAIIGAGPVHTGRADDGLLEHVPLSEAAALPLVGITNLHRINPPHLYAQCLDLSD
jgi:hypothetical protein